MVNHGLIMFGMIAIGAGIVLFIALGFYVQRCQRYEDACRARGVIRYRYSDGALVWNDTGEKAP